MIKLILLLGLLSSCGHTAKGFKGQTNVKNADFKIFRVSTFYRYGVDKLVGKCFAFYLLEGVGMTDVDCESLKKIPEIASYLNGPSSK